MKASFYDSFGIYSNPEVHIFWITVRSIQRKLEKYDVYPHKLMHTYCRELVESGVDIVTVAELTGHSDINITCRYAKPSKKR